MGLPPLPFLCCKLSSVSCVRANLVHLYDILLGISSLCLFWSSLSLVFKSRCRSCTPPCVLCCCCSATSQTWHWIVFKFCRVSRTCSRTPSTRSCVNSCLYVPLINNYKTYIKLIVIIIIILVLFESEYSENQKTGSCGTHTVPTRGNSCKCSREPVSGKWKQGRPKKATSNVSHLKRSRESCQFQQQSGTPSKDEDGLLRANCYQHSFTPFHIVTLMVTRTVP